MIIRVNPNARKFGIACRDGKIIVRVRSKAAENAANREMLSGLSKITGRKAILVFGARSREKKVAFIGMDDGEAERMLAKAGLKPSF
ncbi:MAG: DUF167 domain-containing protein [Candidatus Micrarchaeota archaeon]